jgi:hypothetical protein
MAYPLAWVRAEREAPTSPRLAYVLYVKYVVVNSAYAIFYMPRPEIYPVKKVIGFDQEMLDAIDEWRRRQTPIPTVSDAIRRLIEIGLKSKSKPKSPT